MAIKIVALLLAVCFLRAQGMVRRDASAQTNQLEEISKNADQFAKTFSQQLEHLASAKNTDELNKVLKENTDTILAQVSQLSASFNKALEETNGKAKTAISEASARLEATVADLKQKNPQVEQQTKELGEKIKTAVQSSVQEVDKLAKQFQANASDLGDKIAPSLKQAYDNFIKQADEVQKKIHEAANKA